GAGWHVLPRPLEPERPKEVAKIIDLLGAGEKFPQHRGAPGSEGPKVGRGWLGLCTAVLQVGLNYCGSGEQGAVPSDRRRVPLPAPCSPFRQQIGRASCRDRVEVASVA